MKFLTFSVALFLSSSLSLSAEPQVYTYEIKGMKCDDCVENVKNGVCQLPGIEKCEVSQGQMSLTAKEGTQLDQKAIASAVKKAGHYSVKSFKKASTEMPPTTTTEQKK